MISKESSVTIISKATILLVNFLLVIFTAQIWGSEGRGEIALIMANISIIVISNNILSGSTIAYHSSKLNKFHLLSTSFVGTFIFSLIGSLLFSIYYTFDNFKHLFIIATLISFSNSISLYYLGKKNIKWFNLLTILNPIFIALYLSILYYWFKIQTINAFFYSYYLGVGTVFLIGFIKIIQNKVFEFSFIKIKDLKNIFHYGFNNELSSFFQFLNYRLSYFFIAELLGFHELGIFSVAVSVTEAIWIVSKSMSAIHFSEIINSTNYKKDIIVTSKVALQNFWFSLLLSIILFLLPNSLFTFVFGDNFAEAKTITTYLIPGIIFIAVSNIYGHYFAGIGKLTILKNKSYIGFVATLLAALLLIPKYKLIGACITLNISHFTSSLYLFFMFLKHKKNVLSNKS